MDGSAIAISFQVGVTFRSGIVQRFVLDSVVECAGYSSCKVLRSSQRKGHFKLKAALYDKFLEFAVDNVSRYEQLVPLDSVKKHSGEITADDHKTVIKSAAYESEKIRLFRAAVIDGGTAMQVLNMAIFPRPEYDLPIFCADFFSTVTKSIYVLDLNPLYNVEADKSYKDKYYSELLPLVTKHTELLPWGEKLTGESLQFFSPIVIWSRPENNQEAYDAIYSAFKDYILAWVRLADAATGDPEAAVISRNMEAQHRYLTWRATKDPGRPVLKRLLGEESCESYIKEFLFKGLDSLGTKSFIEYFPEYRCDDGSINTTRSIMGKSYSERPWDDRGTFIGSE